MVRFGRVLFLIALFCGASFGYGASEEKAFKKAENEFRGAFWANAADDFGAFVTNFPTSFRVPEAILYQAEAVITNGDFNQGIKLLEANQFRAGELGDRYLYWMAQAHLGNTNYAAAAQAFENLKKNFPGSTHRLEACVSEAGAYAKLEQWPRVTELLGSTNGVFQQITPGTTNHLVALGYLLLGEAELAQKHFERAREAGAWLGSFPLNPEFAWRRWYLQSRIEIAEGRLEEALASSTNLISFATAAGNKRLRAESYVVVANILEQLREYEPAIAIHEQNLSTNAPVEQQRLALLKIAELSLAQKIPAEAVQRLEKYWTQYPKSEAADTVLLKLGELLLNQALAQPEPATNLLDQAAVRFQTLINQFPSSPLVGNALLGQGWCLWYGAQFAASEEMFRRALERLAFSPDKAVAQFKLADAQFTLGKFNEAIANYQVLSGDYAAMPEVKTNLLELALYQTVRSALAVTNLNVATEAMEKILAWYPNGLTGDRCLLLVSEGYAAREQPARARELLAKFESWSGTETNALLPEVRLARARTFEKEGNWPAAITNYDGWIASFTNHAKLPEALFARAWDTARAGEETNALALFENFVKQFPVHPLTARAKWWMGDYYFQQGDFSHAEGSYPFTPDFAASELYFPAHLRAGRAAMERFAYKDAISYFTNLVYSPACPADIRVKAALAAGDAYMARNDAGATNRAAELEEAAGYFNFVTRNFPTNAQAPLAWGLLGNCYKELGAFDSKYYEKASDAYLKLAQAPGLPVGTQRKAMIGLGIVAEAKAEGKTGAEQKTLFQEALKNYLDAFYAQDLQPGDADDAYWFQKAGWETARLAEALGLWPQAINVYTRLQAMPNLSAPFQATLQKRISKARDYLLSAKN